MSTGRLAQQIKSAPDADGTPYHCKGCGRELGRIIEGRLKLGGVLFHEPFKHARCSFCDGRVRWYPTQSGDALIVHDFS